MYHNVIRDNQYRIEHSNNITCLVAYVLFVLKTNCQQQCIGKNKKIGAHFDTIQIQGNVNRLKQCVELTKIAR